jgi:L-arabinose isomerase
MNTRALKVGLLPFYIQLYDELIPQCRDAFLPLLGLVEEQLRARGLDVLRAPICCVEAEFRRALERLKADGAECLATLHLAYSPSLESADAVCDSRLPVVIVDTTMDAAFGPATPPDRILYNHGVHGVMDFASVLRRRGRPFEIVAGHAGDPRTFDRAADALRAAAAAATLRGSTAVRVGDAFKGMGDFSVDERLLADALGLRVRQVGVEALDDAVRRVDDDAVEREVAEDRARFDCDLRAEDHARAVRVGLGLRQLLDGEGCQAFSVNFQAFDRADRPACTMPFLEISKAMGRGLGYAGEGDVLTAALVAALARGFGEATFTEVFCPDWEGGTLFLSHMGEISPAVAAGRPRVSAKPFFLKGLPDVALLTCAVRPGPATFVNLAPGPGGTFTLLVATVEVLDERPSLNPALRDTVRTWIRPQRPLDEFLEAYSRAGGTHHSALVLGEHAGAVAAFGRLSGFGVTSL